VAGAADGTGDDVRVLPPGPGADADPKSIVDGFLNAEDSSNENDYAIAREYLAPGAEWDTSGTTVVYQNPSTSVHLATGGAAATVTSALSTVATVDPRGVYVPQNGEQSDTYSLAKVRGAWRITALPVGLRLTASGLQRTFVVSTLWWFTPDLRRLVPELRWLPEQTTGRPTQLVRALMGGPAPALAGAVRSAVPPDATLVGSVAADVYQRIEEHMRARAGASPSPAAGSDAEKGKAVQEQITNSNDKATEAGKAVAAVEAKPGLASGPTSTSIKPIAAAAPDPWDALRIGSHVVAKSWEADGEAVGWWIGRITGFEKKDYVIVWLDDPKKTPPFKVERKHVAILHPSFDVKTEWDPKPKRRS